MENMEFLGKLKAGLIEMLTAARTFDKMAGQKPVVKAYSNAKIEILERILVVVIDSIKQGGELDMNKLKTEIEVGDKIKIDELMISQRGGKVEPRILELAKQLQPGEALPVIAESITWAHFSGRVYAMRKTGKLSQDYAPVKRQEKFFLARYPKESK